MKQSILILIACVFIAAVTTLSYRELRSEWISFRKGESLFAQERYLQAAQCYTDALAKGLSVPQLFYHLVEAQLAVGNDAGAIETERAFSASSASTPDTEFMLSEIFVRFGRFEQAMQLLDRSVRQKPDNRRARFRLAQVLTWMGSFNIAVDHYNILLGDQL